MLEVATSTAGVMFQALDRTRLRVRMITEKTILRVLVIAAAVPFGLEAAALSLTVFSVAYHWRYIAYAGRIAPVTQMAVLGTLLGAALPSAAAWIAMSVLSTQMPEIQVVYYAAAILPLTWGIAIAAQLRRVRRSFSSLSG